MRATEATTRKESNLPTQRTSGDPRFPALLEALCCVMAVDGKVSTSERKTIAKVLLDLKAPFTSEEIENGIAKFVTKVKASDFSSVVETAIEQLVANAANERDKKVYLQSLVLVANADKSAHQKERRLISRFQVALASGTTRTPRTDIRYCPNCQAALPQEAVFCISCGYDFRTQQQVITEYGNSVDDGWTRRKFVGRRFTVVKSDDGTPTLVVKRRIFWFIPFLRSEYDLTNYLEVGTSRGHIVRRRQASLSDRYSNDSSLFGGNSDREYVSYVVGEKLRVHLLPRKGKWGKSFTFVGYYDSFSIGDLARANSYTVAWANYNNLIDLVREARPVPLRPRD